MRRSTLAPALLALTFTMGALGGCAHTPTSDAPTLSASTDTAVRQAIIAPPPTAAAAPPLSAPLFAPLPGYAKPPKSDLEARLTPLQFAVTQRAATEPPFQNAYWNNHAAGIYVDVATGEPLFSSADKFESGTGWPSFVRPIDDGHVVSHTDSTFGTERTEVVSKMGASHLGHVFDDGPAPTHLRYCINSASLRFVPVDQLAAQGYGAYASRFGSRAVAAAPVPADTSNACAVPPPGETPGCSATLDVAIFGRAEGDDCVTKPSGVLEVVRGYEGAKAAVEVTYDPAKLTYDDLVASWTRGREAQSEVYTRNDAQRRVAAAKALKVADAEPFRRE